jgi:hypothetical protein
MKFNDNKLNAWGMAVGSALAVLVALVAVIRYEVETGAGVAHCVKRLDSMETRVNGMDDHIIELAENVGALTGRPASHRTAPQTASNEP